LYSMTGFRSRDETFGSCPEDSSRVTLQLIISPRLKQSLNDQLAHKRGEAMISQSSSMNGCWNEGMSEAMHGEERSCGGCVTEIIDKGSLRHGRSGSRLCWNDSDVGAVYFIQDKGEGKTSKVASPTNARCHDVHFLLPKFF